MRRSILVLATVALLAACSDDGRTLQPASPDQTASILVTSTTGPVTSDGLEPVSRPVMTLPWADNTPIPVQYTCQGENVSPFVGWASLPAGTVEVALVMTDPDANSFVHWVVSGLDPAVGQVAQNGVPEDASQSLNDFGSVGYGGPCPVVGNHLYFMTLYALREPSNLPPGGEPSSAIAILDELTLASVTQVGTFAASQA